MDLTPEEFAQTYLLSNLAEQIKSVDSQINQLSSPQKKRSFRSIDYHIDWVQKGYVSSVKNQGQCGSCWAFSSISALESAYLLNKPTLGQLDLSEQELVSCSQLYGNNGCSGGLMQYAFQYIIEKQIGPESEFQYTATNSICKSTNTRYQMKSFQKLQSNNCQNLLQNLQGRPISVAVDATSWQFYTQGVLTQCGTQINHGVTLVGYVLKDGSQAYKIKNSWGVDFGEGGYIYLDAGNNNQLLNKCNICQYSVFPEI